MKSRLPVWYDKAEISSNEITVNSGKYSQELLKTFFIGLICCGGGVGIIFGEVFTRGKNWT